MALLFPNTAAALVEYDASAAERQALWDHAECDDDVYLAQRTDEITLDRVRRAFHYDTQHLNSWSHCKDLSASAMRDLVQKDQQKNA